MEIRADGQYRIVCGQKRNETTDDDDEHKLFFRLSDDDDNELESVPLPIQTFLWRQTK